MDQSIPIELEHIDGNHFNNGLENLTLLSPNCHAQTKTHAGKTRKRSKIRCLREREGWKTVLKNLCKSRQSYGKFFLKQEGMSRVYPEYNLCESGKTSY